MSLLTLRNTNLKPLTNAEMDANLTALNNDKVEKNGSTPITGTQQIHEIKLTKTNPTLILNTNSTLTLGDSTNEIIAAGGITGNASSATKLKTSRTISLGGSLSGSAAFNGTSAITINASVTSISGLNADSASVLNTSRNFSLTGAVTAPAVAFNGSGNVSLSTTLADNIVTPAKIAATGVFDLYQLKVGSGSTISKIIRVTEEVVVPALIDPHASDSDIITVSGVTTSSIIIATPAEALTDTVSITVIPTDTDEITVNFINHDGSYTTAGQTLDFNILVIN